MKDDEVRRSACSLRCSAPSLQPPPAVRPQLQPVPILLHPSSFILLKEWLRLVNDQQFFAAHEVLEGPWLEAEEPERNFLKGLIHVAVALHHYSRRNAHGARVKCRSALRYLEGYPDVYGGVDLAGLRSALRHFFAGVLAGGDVALPANPGEWPFFRGVGEDFSA